VGEQITQHLDEFEQEAQRNGGIQQMLANQFAKVLLISV
jgi:hypothetical protein